MTEQMTTFSVRMDSAVKKRLDEFCSAVGMNTNTAINMFARVVTRDNRLPFAVAADRFYDDSNIRYLTALKADLESGKKTLTEHELIEIEGDDA
ncbi:MAG: type II toxin-antitoxin system RelB/DinJ family antitoxin [Clostridiales bacterium]|nr:type II toxin-antitoxin system RelB/DinJ family antitoxin [Clostridiales bacterium]